MGADYKADAKKAIEKIVVVLNNPQVRYRLGGGKFISMERKEDAFKTALDIECGIDVVQFMPEGGLRGISCRVQALDDQYSFDTFTIRLDRETTGAKTEKEKRIKEIKNGSMIGPGLMLHAYMRGDEILNVGMAKTRNILIAMDRVNNPPRPNTQEDGTVVWFEWVDFKDVDGVWTLHSHDLPPTADEDWIQLPGNLSVEEVVTF